MQLGRFYEHVMSQSIVCMKDGLTGSAWGDWANYTASPLRASDSR